MATEDAEELWNKARAMPHGFIPDFQTDGEYLDLICRAAKFGHLEAMKKLGEYAGRRGAIVEAYFWTVLADLNGASGLKRRLLQMQRQWVMSGCPSERENVSELFSQLQGSFARALLRIRCGIDAPLARVRMKELAEQGCEEARLFLGKGNAPAK